MSDIDSGVYMGGGKGYMEISVPPPFNFVVNLKLREKVF